MPPTTRLTIHRSGDTSAWRLPRNGERGSDRGTDRVARCGTRCLSGGACRLRTSDARTHRARITADHAGRPRPSARHRRARLDVLQYAEPACSLRSEEHTSELQSLMRISYAVFCLKKKTCICTTHTHIRTTNNTTQLNYKIHHNYLTLTYTYTNI